MATVCLNQRLKFSPIRLRTKTATLEYVVSRVQFRSHVWRIINIYRPGSKKATKTFFIELEDIIKKVQYAKEEVLVTGDLNIPMNQKSNNNKKALIDLLAKYGLTQNVTHAMHEKGNVIDLVCSSDLTGVRVKDVKLPSDHYLLTWFPVKKGSKRDKRDWIMHKYPDSGYCDDG